MLNHPCIPGINSLPFDSCEWSFQCSLEFSFLKFCWEFLHLCSAEILAYDSCIVLKWLWYQGNAGLLKWIWGCHFLYTLFEELKKAWYSPNGGIQSGKPSDPGCKTQVCGFFLACKFQLAFSTCSLTIYESLLSSLLTMHTRFWPMEGCVSEAECCVCLWANWWHPQGESPVMCGLASCVHHTVSRIWVFLMPFKILPSTLPASFCIQSFTSWLSNLVWVREKGDAWAALHNWGSQGLIHKLSLT